MSKEMVLLVDDSNNVIGTAIKAEVHHRETPLHRGFSCFLFRPGDGMFLLQQRALTKKTWPGVWSNSCCGHPMPGEENGDAVRRRVWEELGIRVKDVHEVLPHYRYRAEFLGVVENELCPVFVSFSDEELKLNREEVYAVRWLTWSEWLREIKERSGEYSHWCVEETRLLQESNLFHEIIRDYVS